MKERCKVLGTRIQVIGCGNGGGNTVNRIEEIGLFCGETIVINTDRSNVEAVNADKKILIGRELTSGLGTSGSVELGKICGEMAKDELSEIINSDLAFVIACLGGGTGTGIAPIVAKTIRKSGGFVVGIATLPFQLERARLRYAYEGLEKLRKEANGVIVIDNNSFSAFGHNLPIHRVFSLIDQLIGEIVIAITDTLTFPSIISFDLADMKKIVNGNKIGIVLYGESYTNETGKVVSEAINHPLLDIDYTCATGSLIHITGGNDLTPKKVQQIADCLTYGLNAEVIIGAKVATDYEGRIRVVGIMTGIPTSHIVCCLHLSNHQISPIQSIIGGYSI
ncbi:MAG: cell division protein FtsZ [Candidatus Thermoplasmatota archaeon]